MFYLGKQLFYEFPTPFLGLFLFAYSPCENNIIFCVEDTGVGISKETLKSIFKVGKKISKKGTKGESGTGLGLTLCKDFVEMNSGKIWVKSESEKGSQFFFTAPFHSN